MAAASSSNNNINNLVQLPAGVAGTTTSSSSTMATARAELGLLSFPPDAAFPIARIHTLRRHGSQVCVLGQNELAVCSITGGSGGCGPSNSTGRQPAGAPAGGPPLRDQQSHLYPFKNNAVAAGTNDLAGENTTGVLLGGLRNFQVGGSSSSSSLSYRSGLGGKANQNHQAAKHEPEALSVDFILHDFAVDTVTWEPSGKFLFCGDSAGKMHCIHVASKAVIWQQPVGGGGGAGGEQEGDIGMNPNSAAATSSSSGFLDIQCHRASVHPADLPTINASHTSSAGAMEVEGAPSTNSVDQSSNKKDVGAGNKEQDHSNTSSSCAGGNKFTLSFLLRSNSLCCFNDLDFSELDLALETAQPEKAKQAVSALHAKMRKTQVKIPNARQYSIVENAIENSADLFAVSDSALLAYTSSGPSHNSSRTTPLYTTSSSTSSRSGFHFRDSVPIRAEPVLIRVFEAGEVVGIQSAVLVICYPTCVEVYDAKALLLLSRWQTKERIRAASVVPELAAITILTDKMELRRMTNGEVFYTSAAEAEAGQRAELLNKGTTMQAKKSSPVKSAAKNLENFLTCSGLFVATDDSVSVLIEQPKASDLTLQNSLENDFENSLLQQNLSISQLRRQMEIAIERSITGELHLQVSLIVNLAKKMSTQIPSFVANSALRCVLQSIKETRQLLTEVVALLESSSNSTSKAYDLKRGLQTITEALARLATFEQLGELRQILDSLSIGKTAQRASLSGSRGGNKGGLCVGAAKLKELGMIWNKNADRLSFGSRQKMLQNQNNNNSNGAATGSLSLNDGSASTSTNWNPAIWQQFRLTSLPQLCIQLAQAERISDMLTIFARHGTKFTQQEVMQLLEAIPFCSLAEDEARLPDWVGSQVLPLLSHATEKHDARRRLVNWLTSRALDLEQAKGCDKALQLLKAVLTPHNRMLFPDAFVCRANLWAGVALHHKQQVRGCNKNEEKLRRLFQELSEMIVLRDLHCFPLRLRDLQQLSHTDIVSKFLQRVGAAALLKDEILFHVKSYCERHELDLDTVLFDYVRTNLVTSSGTPEGGRYQDNNFQLGTGFGAAKQNTAAGASSATSGNNPAENGRKLERAIEVLKCITDPTTKAKALLHILQLSNTNSQLQEVVKDCKENPDVPQDLKDEIDGQIRLLDAYDVLSKHNLSQKVMINPVYAQRVCMYLLSNIHSGTSAESTLDDALVLLRVFPGAILSPLDARILRATKIVSADRYESQVLDLKSVLSSAGEQCLEVCDGVVEFCCSFLKTIYDNEKTEERVLSWLHFRNKKNQENLESENADQFLGKLGGGAAKNQKQNDHNAQKNSNKPDSQQSNEQLMNPDPLKETTGAYAALSPQKKQRADQHCDLAIISIRHVFAMKNWHDVNFYHRKRRRSSDSRNSGGLFSATAQSRKRSTSLDNIVSQPGGIAAGVVPTALTTGDQAISTTQISSYQIDEEEEEAAYGSGWSTFGMLDALQRLSKLQKQFKLYGIDPVLLLGNRADHVLSALFERHASSEVHAFLDQAEQAAAARAASFRKEHEEEEEMFVGMNNSSGGAFRGQQHDGLAVQPAATSTSTTTTSALFTRLLHLADLLGLGRTYVWQLIVREASSKGQVASLRLTMDLVPKDHTLRETSGELLDLVRSVVSHFRANLGRNQKNCAALIFHLAHLLDLLTYCLDWCGARPESSMMQQQHHQLMGANYNNSNGFMLGNNALTPAPTNPNAAIEAQNLLPLVTYAGDLHFAVNLLLSSDLLDTDAHVRKTAPRKHLSVVHAHIIENLHENDPYEQLFSNQFKEVASLLPGPAALKLVLEFLTEPQYLESPGVLEHGGSGLRGGNGTNGFFMPVRTAPYRLSNTPTRLSAGRSHPYRRISNGTTGRNLIGMNTGATSRMNSMPARFNTGAGGQDSQHGTTSANHATTASNHGINNTKLSLPAHHPHHNLFSPHTTPQKNRSTSLKEIYDMLRTSRCLDWAKQAIARGLWDNSIDVSPRNNCSSNSHLYQELCQESALSLIFGTSRGSTLDALLFLGYMGCLSHEVCRDVYQQAITQIEQEGASLKMQELCTLGRVLGFLLKKDDLKIRMEKSETTWKWSTRLKGFDLPFDLLQNTKEDQRLTNDLLPEIIQKSQFSLPIVLEFASDFKLNKPEVLALWVKLMLLRPTAPAKNRCWILQVSSEGQEVFKQVFDQSYQHKIPPHLPFLDDPTLVLQTVLSGISPYDYERIRFVLRFLCEKSANKGAGGRGGDTGTTAGGKLDSSRLGPGLEDLNHMIDGDEGVEHQMRGNMNQRGATTGGDLTEMLARASTSAARNPPGSAASRGLGSGMKKQPREFLNHQQEEEDNLVLQDHPGRDGTIRQPGGTGTPVSSRNNNNKSGQQVPSSQKKFQQTNHSGSKPNSAARPSSPHPFPRALQQTTIKREASALERVLEVLQRYHRFSPPSDREKKEITKWRKEKGLSVEVEHIVLQLAESRLPWHYLLQNETRWTFLRPELAARSEDGVKRLLPITCYLPGISPDDVHLEYLKHLLTTSCVSSSSKSLGLAASSGAAGGASSTTSASSSSSSGTSTSSSKNKIAEHLRLIQDKDKAERAAAEIQKQLKLSPELCEVAAFRAERASQAVLAQIQDLDKNPDRDPKRRQKLRQLQEEKAKLVKNSLILKSRLDLRDWGWEMFENVLIRCGAVTFMTCVYYYLAPRTAKIPLSEFHNRVDIILRRHGSDPKKEKIALMRTWLTSGSWTPTELVKNDPAGQVEIAELEKIFSSSSGRFSAGGVSGDNLQLQPSGSKKDHQHGALGGASSTSEAEIMLTDVKQAITGNSAASSSTGAASGGNGNSNSATGVPFAALTELWCQSPNERQMIARIALVAAPGVTKQKLSAKPSDDMVGSVFGDDHIKDVDGINEHSQSRTTQHQHGDDSNTKGANSTSLKRHRNISPERADQGGDNNKSSGGHVSSSSATEQTTVQENLQQDRNKKKLKRQNTTSSADNENGENNNHNPSADETSTALRSVIRLYLHWLLRDSLTTNACCRCFCVLLQVATVQEILTVYHHPPEELWDYFRTFLYLNALEKLRVGHIDLTTFRDTDKEGLARSYWRQQHKDPLLVAVITGLVLDFQVYDPKFLSQILLRLLQLQMSTFLQDALLHMHNSGFLLEMPLDNELGTAFQKILLDHSCQLVQQGLNKIDLDQLNHAIDWLKLVPQLLKRSPYVTHLKILEAARQILESLLNASVVGRQLLSKHANFGKELDASGNYIGSGGTSTGHMTTNARTTTFGMVASASTTISSTTGTSAGQNTIIAAAERIFLLTLELAYCTPQANSLLDDFVVKKYPVLLPLCLSGLPPGALRPGLFHAVLQQNFVKEVRAYTSSTTDSVTTTRTTDSQLFSELVIYAVKQSQIKNLLDAAIDQNLLEDAVNLVFLYARHHGILHVWQTETTATLTSSTVVNSEKAKFLQNLVSQYEHSKETAGREFARLCRMKQ
ncbi:unnamed protein product [Amoebophrya sp. A120]|nr:unnamed protein product [Amoebophrya sp. A120]|eukprot:GSA120T00014912001.1